MNETPVDCPRCGSASIPIIYGLPDFETFQAADRGEVALGGCGTVVDEAGETIDPDRRCAGIDCGMEFDSRALSAAPAGAGRWWGE